MGMIIFDLHGGCYSDRTLWHCLVHPTAPVLLTKNGPLGTPIRCEASIKQVPLLTHLKFENKLRAFRPQYF